MKRDQPGLSWEQMRRLELDARRREFRTTSPGQRVEQQLILSAEVTALAERAQHRKR